eukprot:TRINITY_DN4_c0_g1_i14.p1 TRINITY_DN4_c0_g1~~TRINITY_DN4_c0_g1_i14.p1  ORF type:complete len:356 (-),score=89.89 TRINITY_DN4_c0_g1_i14:152-1219(-)
MIRRPPRSTLSSSSAASDVYKRQGINAEYGRLGDAMGARPSAEKRRKQQRQKEHPEREERRAVVQASPPLVLNMEAPIQCQVDAHEAETVQELLEALAVDRFELRKADAEKLTLEFGDEPMSERHRTLVAIGMCDQAEFSVLGVAQTKAAKACSGGSCAAERVCAGGHLGCRVQWTGGGGAPRVGRLPRASGRNLEQQPDLAAHRRRIRADRGGRHTGAGQGQHPCPKPGAYLPARLPVSLAVLRCEAAVQWESSALHYAAIKGHLAVVEALLQAKADLNARDKDGNTALHATVEKRHLAVVEALLEAQADVNQTNHGGRTALWMARESQGAYDTPEEIVTRNEIMLLLRAHTAQ